jgi:amino acid transporter
LALADVLFGRALPTSDERAEQIGPSAGIPIFGLDALSSAGYGPEAALTLLLPLGILGLRYIAPITLAILILLTIVYFSYRQTIAAYPGGGGSYTVARENLGENAGLLAAAALMIDYILTVAVGISAGVGALVSVVPSLQPRTLGLCLVILLLIALVNLRGLREAGKIFMVPTYLFIGTLIITIVVGLVRALFTGGHPNPIVAPHQLHPAVASVGAWLLLQSFASGCTAMTGVEAVSNGVRAFREPGVKNARTTLTVIIVILVILLAGIAYLCRIYHVGATDPGQPGYESVLSQIIGAVAGKGIFYLIAMASILAVLALSANTAFADFPRLCQMIALNRYLPSSFASRGRRLVFSGGIYVLTFLAGALLIIFGGVTDRLIPLYAIGAFLAFTLSQAGMVMHWRRTGGEHALHSMLVNGLGAFVTAITVLVVLVAKFVEGAWITLLLIPALMLLMKAVHREYLRIGDEIASDTPLDFSDAQPPLVIVPIKGWSKVTKKALRFAAEMSSEVLAVQVEVGEGDCDDMLKCWKGWVVEPAKAAGRPAPQLKIIQSPYRRVLFPIIKLAIDESRAQPTRQLAIVIPEIVQDRWYNYALHNQRAAALKAMLYFLGNRQIMVVNVPWYLRSDKRERNPA